MYKIHNWAMPLLFLVLLAGCSKEKKGPEILDKPRPHAPYTITDSSKLQNVEGGLVIYTELEGPGAIPKSGDRVVMDYIGMLEDGTIFDNSYERAEPFAFTLGQTDVINGMAEGISRLRYGTKAILIIPPSLGYGDKKELPNIPPNSTLYFHVNVLGSF